MDNSLLGERELSKLRWRCRRGLLENDLFIERFFNKYDTCLTVWMADGLIALMELSDNDLLDLHLSRKSIDQFSQNLDREDVIEVLKLLKDKH